MTGSDSIPGSRIRPWIIIGVNTALLFGGAIYFSILHPVVVARAAVRRLKVRRESMYFVSLREDDLRDQFIKKVFGDECSILVESCYIDDKSSRLLTDSDLICCRDLPALRWLGIEDQPITSQGLQHLSHLHLDSLFLEDTRVGSGCQALNPSSRGLEPLASLTDLKYLTLNRSWIVDADLSALSKLENLFFLGTEWQSDYVIWNCTSRQAERAPTAQIERNTD